MGSLHFQSFVDVVAFPAGFLVVDLHVERQGEFAAGKDRIEMSRQRLEDMLAGLLAGREVTYFTEPQYHREKAELRIAVADRIMLAFDGADADAADREDTGLHRRLADQFDNGCHVDALVE